MITTWHNAQHQGMAIALRVEEMHVPPAVVAVGVMVGTLHIRLRHTPLRGAEPAVMEVGVALVAQDRVGQTQIRL